VIFKQVIIADHIYYAICVIHFRFITKMPSCAVATCKNTHISTSSPFSSEPPKLHKFPKGEVGLKWESLCKRADKINLRNAVICSDHFVPDNYERNLKAELLKLNVPKKLKKDALPSLHLPNNHSDPKCSLERDNRAIKRRSRKLVLDLTRNESHRNLIFYINIKHM